MRLALSPVNTITDLYVDIETYSNVNLKKQGLYKYVQAPSFEVLLFAYSINKEPAVCIDLTIEKLPIWLEAAMVNPNIQKHAFNAAFENYCLSKYFKVDPMLYIEQWRCTMLHSLYCGLPAKLDLVGKALELDEDKQKMKSGTSLITKFCTPASPTKRNPERTRIYPKDDPAKWELFKKYNRTDVDSEVAIEIRLSSWPVPDTLQKQWVRDMRINMRGVKVDAKLAKAAKRMYAEVKDKLIQELNKITRIINSDNATAFRAWCIHEILSIEGQDFSHLLPNLQKDTIKSLLKTKEIDIKSDKYNRLRTAINLYQESHLTSIAKYDSMLEHMSEDGFVRGMAQFYGAGRTGRWAGRGVQLQNMPRTDIVAPEYARELVKQGNIEALELIYGSPAKVLSMLVRTAFIPDEGMIFNDADYHAIEAVVAAWIAKEEWRLEVFRTHGKIYEASASQMFGIELGLIKKGFDEYRYRARGKVAELALGYGGAVNAILAMPGGDEIPVEELPGLVKAWRKANPNIVATWWALGDAAIETIKYGKETEVCGIRMRRESSPDNPVDYFLTVQLYNGRKLFYYRPFIAPKTINTVKGPMTKDSIFFYGVNQVTNKWGVIDTYGPKLFENIVQAVARDLLAECFIDRAENAGMLVRFSVHDEAITEVPIAQAKEKQEELKQIIVVPPWWASTMPITADGWVKEFYTKD